jgi:hypothetical protein
MFINIDYNYLMIVFENFTLIKFNPNHHIFHKYIGNTVTIDFERLST